VWSSARIRPRRINVALAGRWRGVGVFQDKEKCWMEIKSDIFINETRRGRERQARRLCA